MESLSLLGLVTSRIKDHEMGSMESYMLSFECTASSPENSRTGLRSPGTFWNTIRNWEMGLSHYPVSLSWEQILSPIPALEPCTEQQKKPSPNSPEVYCLVEGQHGESPGLRVRQLALTPYVTVRSMNLEEPQLSYRYIRNNDNNDPSIAATCYPSQGIILEHSQSTFLFFSNNKE